MVEEAVEVVSKGSIIARLKGFMGEVKAELAKCTWPTRPELIQSTHVVIISCLIFAAFVALSDYGLSFIVKGIVNLK